MTRAEHRKRAREKRKAAMPPKVLPPCPEFFRGSLTSHISRDGFVRRYIDEYFPKLPEIARDCSRRLRESGLSVRPSPLERRFVSIAGIAIDYRIRAYFKRGIDRSGAVAEGLRKLSAVHSIAHTAPLEMPQAWISNPWHGPSGRRIRAAFLASYRKFVARHHSEKRRLPPRVEERLCRYCIIFAFLDSIGRAPLSSAMMLMITQASPDIETMLAGVDRAVVEEVMQLAGDFYRQHRRMIVGSRRATIGATLAGSADIGGADFDLLVDGCLFDVKVTREPAITVNHLRQLAGYWLLDYQDALKIRKVAIALVRHGHIEYFDVEAQLLEPAMPAARVRDGFRKALRKLSREGAWPA